MPNHPIAFGICLALSIAFALLLVRTLYVEFKYGRTSSTHFYYSDEFPPLTREQYIEVAGVDPVELMKKNHS